MADRLATLGRYASLAEVHAARAVHEGAQAEA